MSSAVSVTNCPQLRRGEKQLDVGKGFWSCKWQDLVCSWMCVMGISLILEDFESGLGDQKKVGKARPPDPWEIVPLPFAMSPIPWTKSPAEPHEKAQTCGCFSLASTFPSGNAPRAFPPQFGSRCAKEKV